ncbi:DNA-directed DNA polymerase II small subunit [Candidatus Micrarchaeota archaeon]|nr:DNA-directed DNA polymerase II small subunit [Candidatus Micrarchaeota archaeon]
MVLLSRIKEKGLRISLEAEKLLENEPFEEQILNEILSLDKVFIEKEDIEKAINKAKKAYVEVKRQSSFRALAREYSPDLKIIHQRDITGKSRTEGKVNDFVEYFKNRYSRLARLLRKSNHKYPEIGLEDVKKMNGERGKIIAMITEKRETKKGNLFLEIEDLTGAFKVVISKSDEKLFEKAQKIILDDVIAIYGKILDAFIICEDFEWPDLPITREKKLSENNLATVYLSDIHFGSRYHLEGYLEQFLLWIEGKNGSEELASKVKYILIAGDLVDGIGIYPNQEKELIVTDVYKQYELFNDFVERIPDYIEIVSIPGNHDAVRRGEPCPALEKEMVHPRVHNLGNPATAVIEGITHTLYHGTSMDSMISALGHLSYKKPEKVMEEFLKRRHLSPIYGGNLIIPEHIDYLVLEEEPDIFHVGHIHKNGYGYYRGTLMINSGTFQDRTEFQIKQGHVPTPGMVPVYEMKTGRLKTLNFAGG